MRVIKFRAWNKAEKRMGNVLSISFIGENSISAVVGYDNGGISFETEDTVSLLQYTGLKDKNDKEIYEGDIVEVHHALWRVAMYENRQEWMIFHAKGGANTSLEFDAPFSEVLGNVYENPELLEDGDRN